jgi:predicted RNase H-like HicB family nuclease
MIPIEYEIIIFSEENTFVAYCPQLDISSCGKDVDHARSMLKTAIILFIEEAEKMGTITDILEEAKYKQDVNGRWITPKLVATELITVP